tara:strand:- start:354 stop:803 length:450 start_codon:yes stop_codon:yes gene_type:complete
MWLSPRYVLDHEATFRPIRVPVSFLTLLLVPLPFVVYGAIYSVQLGMGVPSLAWMIQEYRAYAVLAAIPAGLSWLIGFFPFVSSAERTSDVIGIVRMSFVGALIGFLWAMRFASKNELPSTVFVVAGALPMFAFAMWNRYWPVRLESVA